MFRTLAEENEKSTDEADRVTTWTDSPLATNGEIRAEFKDKVESVRLAQPPNFSGTRKTTVAR